MGQVQNGRLYFRYRSSSQKNEAEERKKTYRIHLFALYIAKSTLKTPLTFSKVEKTKHANFDFVHLLSSSSLFFFFFSFKHKLKSIRLVKTLNIPNGLVFYCTLFLLVFRFL